MVWVLITLLASGSLVLSAAPGGNGKGSSGAGERGNRASVNRTGKGGKASVTSEAQLANHPRLASKLAGLLPGETDLQAAASGFRNLGQFVAAVHVSRNLGISFNALKTEMVDHALSLGQAIHLLKHEVDAGTEARKAQASAEAEIVTSS
jgi:hypothetical protein